MLPSSTVENYLKAIFLGEGQLPQGERLFPMGQLASALDRLDPRDRELLSL